jgi:4-carboxymuconolactone decarboxylase
MRLVAAILAAPTVISSSIQANEEKHDGAIPRSVEPRHNSAVSPALDQFTQERLLGEVWQRPGLDARDRNMITLAALIARDQTIELPFYLNHSLEPADQVAEMMAPSRGMG